VSSAPPAGTGQAYHFELSPSLVDDQGPRSLCSVAVHAQASDGPEAILHRTADAVNRSTHCSAAGVFASVDEGRAGEGEDEFRRRPRLRLASKGLVGAQLVTSLGLAPGESTNRCFALSHLGIPMLGQLQTMSLQLSTAAAGASGGELTLFERSGLGECSITMPTSAGQSAEELAVALAAAFRQPGIPGPHPDCPSEHNPRDVTRLGSSVLSVAASNLEVCSADAGVGFALRPTGLGNVHAVAVAGDDQLVECTGPEGATVVLDGSGSSDPDSTPGTADDIALYEWLEDLGTEEERLLGTGPVLMPTLPLGEHSITLRITDQGGLTSTDHLQVRIQDTSVTPGPCEDSSLIFEDDFESGGTNAWTSVQP
jgi:hypothetical protein